MRLECGLWVNRKGWGVGGWGWWERDRCVDGKKIVKGMGWDKGARKGARIDEEE